ncbi:MAG: putative transport system permease protein [Kosmotogales bacterium]|nr:putative transport system permease protein [Kosmotogales bacterium]
MEVIIEALRSLWNNKMRTILSMLGIVIGITSVVSIAALGEGTTASVTESISSLGAKNITISSFSSYAYPLLYSYGMDIEEMCPNVENTIVTLQGNYTIKSDYGDDSETVLGIEEEYMDVMQYDILSGSDFSEEDHLNKNSVAIIGNVLAETLYPDMDPVGQMVYVIQDIGNFTKKNSFEIVGVMESGTTNQFSDPSNFLYIPFSTAEARIFQSQGEISNLVAVASSEDTVSKAMKEIDYYLYREFDGKEYYRISNQQQILNVMNDTLGLISFVLIAVAAISLFVGGIGIMNIMLVSVTERTREIGIKMAIGASRKRILTEFLVESVLITFIAGIIGILLALALTSSLEHIATSMSLHARLSPEIAIIAFLVSAGIGLLSGLYPANKASRLSPIEALRYE